MDKVFKWIGGGIIFILALFIGFWVWCEVEHDKTAIEFIQDKFDKQEESVDETTTEDEIVVENEDETVTATFSIDW